MKRNSRQVSFSQPSAHKRGAMLKAMALPKGAKEFLRKGEKGKIVTLSPSQPHSKSFGR